MFFFQESEHKMQLFRGKLKLTNQQLHLSRFWKIRGIFRRGWSTSPLSAAPVKTKYIILTSCQTKNNSAEGGTTNFSPNFHLFGLLQTKNRRIFALAA